MTDLPSERLQNATQDSSPDSALKDSQGSGALDSKASVGGKQATDALTKTKEFLLRKSKPTTLQCIASPS